MSHKRRVRRRAPISDEDAEFLKQEFGSISDGIRKLISMYKHSLGPRSPTLRMIHNALVEASEASNYEISWSGAVETICKTLGCTRDRAYKYVQELFEEGYMTHSEKPGHVRVLPKRRVTIW